MATNYNPNTEENLEECRILIVGLSGSGKSSLGNRLLGLPGVKPDEKADSKHEDLAEGGFVVSSGSDSVTKLSQYQTQRRFINGKEFSLKVVDTPGLFDPVEPDIKLTLKEITRSMALCCPGGPHVIMFVVPYGRFTEEKKNSFDAVMKLFGETVKKHMMIVFTHGEDLQGKSIKEELAKSKAKGMQELLAAVRDNIVVCSNLPDCHDAERNAVLEMVGSISHNCTTHYSNPLLVDLTKCIEKKISKIMNVKGLSYAEAIWEVRRNILEADEKSALWNELLQIVARSSLFGIFVAIFFCVSVAWVSPLIAAALGVAVAGGGIAVGASFSDHLKKAIAKFKSS